MKKLIILAILLCFPAILSAKPIKDRIDARIAVIDKTQTETAINEAMTKIVREEIETEVAPFKEAITPPPLDLLEIDILALTTLTTEQLTVKLGGMTQPELSRLSVAIYNFRTQNQSRELDKVLQAIRTKQYPMVKFPFLETTSDDPAIYIVNVDDQWVDIVKMQEALKKGNIKLVVLMSDWLNNAALIELGGNINDFPLKGKAWEIPYQAAKEVAPNVPVGFIAVMCPGLETWLKSFTITPDVWCLFNVPTFGANWTKVKNRWFKDRPVIANLNHDFRWHNYGNQQYGGVKYKETISTLKALGFQGTIFWR